MTTDAAVAEAPVEETPALVTQDSPPDNTPVGDAGEQPVADAAPASQEPQIDLSKYEADADAYLKDLEGKGSDTAATEATRPTEPQREPDPSKNFLEHRQNTRVRHDKVDAYEKELLEWGMPEPTAKRFLNEIKGLINEEHGDGIRLSGSTSATVERAVMIQSLDVLGDAYIEKLTKAVKPANGAPPNWREMYKALKQIAFDEGKAAGEKDGRRAGYLDGRAHGERTQSSARSGQQVQGSPEGRSFSNEDALDTAFANKEISRDVYAREKKRLTGRDL